MISSRPRRREIRAFFTRDAFDKIRRCHGLGPWCFTFVANQTGEELSDATGSPRGVSRLSLTRQAKNCQMPRARPVESHACTSCWQNVSSTGQARGIRSGNDCPSSDQREPPRGEPVASGQFLACLVSNERETPRGEPVASGQFLACLVSKRT